MYVPLDLLTQRCKWNGIYAEWRATYVLCPSPTVQVQGCTAFRCLECVITPCRCSRRREGKCTRNGTQTNGLEQCALYPRVCVCVHACFCVLVSISLYAGQIGLNHLWGAWMCWGVAVCVFKDLFKLFSEPILHRKIGDGVPGCLHLSLYIVSCSDLGENNYWFSSSLEPLQAPWKVP